jgi:serine protease AprX
MGTDTRLGKDAPGASWVRRRALTVTAALATLVAAGAAMGPAAQAAPAPASTSAVQHAYVVRADAGHLTSLLKELHAQHVAVTGTLGIIDAAVVQTNAAEAAALAHLGHVAEVTQDVSLGVESDSYDPVSDAGSAYNIARSLGVDPADGATGAGTAVALIDTGVSPVGPLANTWITNGPDLSFDSQTPSTRYLDLNGHGTVMAGLIAADPEDGQTYSGMAPDTRLVNIKVGDAVGRADVSQVIAGLDWAVQHKDELGIRVINLSFGTDSTQSYLLDPLAHAAEVAWRKGIVVVASAGNGGGNRLSMPAADPYVIAVGALDGQGTVTTSDDVLAPFSAQGSWRRPVDLVVPGVRIQGLRVPGSYVSDELGPTGGINADYLRGSGTSEAAAIVSGLVADLLSARPWLTPDQVKALLTSTGSDVDDTQGVIPDLDAALSAPTPRSWEAAQRDLRSFGGGSLEAARGSYHVSDGNELLTGEQDIFGNPVNTRALAAAEEAGRAWRGGVWNGASWAGASWAGASWAGASWAGASWAGASWAGAGWAGEDYS